MGTTARKSRRGPRTRKKKIRRGERRRRSRGEEGATRGVLSKKTKTAPVDEAPLTVYDPTLSLAGPSQGARLALRPHFRCELVSCRWRRASSGIGVVGTKLRGSSGLGGLL